MFVWQYHSRAVFYEMTVYLHVSGLSCLAFYAEAAKQLAGPCVEEGEADAAAFLVNGVVGAVGERGYAVPHGVGVLTSGDEGVQLIQLVGVVGQLLEAYPFGMP